MMKWGNIDTIKEEFCDRRNEYLGQVFRAGLSFGPIPCNSGTAADMLAGLIDLLLGTHHIFMAAK